MFSNLTGILIFLTIFGIVVSIPNRAVDCRKFVFAPLCRGVAAKRDSPVPENYDTNALYKEGMEYLLRYLHSAPPFVLEDEDEGSTERTNIQNEIENFAKTIQGRMNSLLKLLLKSRSNSERDYSPEGELGNM